MPEEVHGAAHVRFSENEFNPREFYAVFFNGVLQPTQFKSWSEAREHFVTLLYKVIEAQPA
jgi:hypothetical protein